MIAFSGEEDGRNFGEVLLMLAERRGEASERRADRRLEAEVAPGGTVDHSHG
jgi:hypothetical protein